MVACPVIPTYPLLVQLDTAQVVIHPTSSIPESLFNAASCHIVGCTRVTDYLLPLDFLLLLKACTCCPATACYRPQPHGVLCTLLQGRTALHMTAEPGNIASQPEESVVQALVAAGADMSILKYSMALSSALVCEHVATHDYLCCLVFRIMLHTDPEGLVAAWYCCPMAR